jgi:hypothetical protein
LAAFRTSCAAFCSAAFSFAPAYDSVTKSLPPVQPNAHAINTIPRMMFHDVVTSCWATEYAVACSEVATPLSEATLKA